MLLTLLHRLNAHKEVGYACCDTHQLFAISVNALNRKHVKAGLTPCSNRDTSGQKRDEGSGREAPSQSAADDLWREIKEADEQAPPAESLLSGPGDEGKESADEQFAGHQCLSIGCGYRTHQKRLMYCHILNSHPGITDDSGAVYKRPVEKVFATLRDFEEYLLKLSCEGTTLVRESSYRRRGCKKISSNHELASEAGVIETKEDAISKHHAASGSDPGPGVLSEQLLGIDAEDSPILSSDSEGSPIASDTEDDIVLDASSSSDTESTRRKATSLEGYASESQPQTNCPINGSKYQSRF